MLPCGRETVELAFAIFSTFLHARNFLLQQDKALDSCLDQWAHLAAAAGVELPTTEEVFGVLPKAAAEHVQEGAVDRDAQKARTHHNQPWLMHGMIFS